MQGWWRKLLSPLLYSSCLSFLRCWKLALLRSCIGYTLPRLACFRLAKNSIAVSIFALPLVALANNNAILQQIKVNTATQNNAQLTLNLTEPARYQWFFLQNPNRLVLDFQKTNNKTSLNDLPLTKNTLITKIRAGLKPQNGLRLVFDLNQAASVLVKSLPPTSQYAERLTLDLNARANSHTVIAPIKPVTARPRQVVSTKTNTASVKPVMSLPSNVPPRKLVVVIDPGHGGKDPGATGPGGVHEKNVVLAISRNLYQLLKTQPGITVYMTRYGDYYIGLRQRLQIARRDKADIFIAIHADAYRDAYSTGASVFALSLRGASSEAARWLAEKENYSELGGVDLNGKNDTLRSVLIDLSQTATISSSLGLGGDVLGQISRISPLHKSKVEQAPFVVLKSPDIASILVETGFISNPAEERALSNAAYQRKMALAIELGINQYIKQHPPSGR